MYVILMGAQGSGKGTQASLLGPELHLVKVATGELFRQAIAEQTPLGMQVKSMLDAGELVPDELTNALVRARLTEIARAKQQDADVAGALFDGFPRTAPQAAALDEMLAEHGEQIRAVVEIVVPRDKLIARLAGRRVCESCNTVYHIVSDPPRVAGICDRDGGRVIQREDDTPEAITRRLALYDELTAPLLSYYRQRGVLKQVDGDQDIGDVHRDILAAIGVPVEMDPVRR